MSRDTSHKKPFPEVIALRVPDFIYKKISKLADAENRPVGAMARILVAEALNKRNSEDKKHGKT